MKGVSACFGPKAIPAHARPWLDALKAAELARYPGDEVPSCTACGSHQTMLVFGGGWNCLDCHHVAQQPDVTPDNSARVASLEAKAAALLAELKAGRSR